MLLDRRTFLRSGALAAGAVAFGPGFWRQAFAAGARAGEGPYGPLGPADANGIMLPEGFRSQLVARGQQPVAGTDYVFHLFPDGEATYATPDGGFILVSNSEVPVDGQGGASAIRFGADGRITDAYRILSGTRMNCSGGPTPWGTWLSCEEFGDGRVFECDPTGERAAVELPALGQFSHEAACVDPAGQRLYLTEDAGDGGFYRFTPDAYPDLAAGLLEIAVVGDGGAVRWVAVPKPIPGPADPDTKDQVEGSTVFQRGEGMWFDSGVVYLATTTDAKVHAYDTRTERIEVIYDKAAFDDPPLTDIDNITVAPSGDLYACEDIGDGDASAIDIGLITPEREVSRFLRLTPEQHSGSEATGPIFDPSGSRFFFASQRAGGTGAVYMITGPFRAGRQAAPAPAPASASAPGSSATPAPGPAPGQAMTGPDGRPAADRPPAPALGIEVPRRIRFDTLRSRGVPVLLTLDDPAEVSVRVQARFRPVASRKRGAGRRRGRRPYRLAGAGARLERGGPRLLRAALSPQARRLLAGRRRPLRLVVEVTLRAGGRERTVERTLVAAPGRR